MPGPKNANSRARPIRVAYLVDDHSHSLMMLKAIFQECMGRWGGRFTLVVPCNASGPEKAYEKWLEAFDADILYSYVDMDDTIITRLHEWLYPSQLVKHDTYNTGAINAQSLSPRLPLKALSDLTLIPIVTAPTFLDATKGAMFLDAYGRSADDVFVRDSFGYFLRSAGHSFGGPLSEFGALLTLVHDDEAQPRDRYLRGVETIENREQLLGCMMTKRVITMAHLSAFGAPRLSIEGSRWARSFNITVGDTFADNVLFWNSRLLYPKWHDSQFVTLKVPEALLADDAFIGALSPFVQRRNNVTGVHGTGSTPCLTVRSTSVPLEELNDFAAKLKGRNWMQCDAEVISNLEECRPTDAELERASMIVSEGLQSRPLWSETSTGDGVLNLTPPSPEHLRFCPATFHSFHYGEWAVDLDIERKVNHSRFENVDHRWRFPRRLRITSAFSQPYQLNKSHGGLVTPRASSEGYLTLFANAETGSIEVKLPTDENAIATALLAGRDWRPFGRNRVAPEQLLKDVRQSENGRYFRGVLNICGSLNEATGFFLSNYWHKVFEKLGASAMLTENRRKEVERTLAKKFGRFAPRFPDDIPRLAGMILHEADQYRTGVPRITWDALTAEFLAQQKKEWERYDEKERDTDRAKEMQAHEAARFKDEVQDLCKLGMLYQGYAFRCPVCLHKSWISIDNLRAEIRCDVCQRPYSAPVDKPWDFRLNEFVREAFRKHGILPLFWALSRFRDFIGTNFRETNFFFEGPLDVYTSADRYTADSGDTDIDLIVVSDGVVRMCEVKQSERQLSKTKIGDFSKLMLRLRPNIATIAVMSEETPAIRRIFEKVKEELSGSGIEPELVTLEPGDFTD